jgi:hypothetical protein
MPLLHWNFPEMQLQRRVSVRMEIEGIGCFYPFGQSICSEVLAEISDISLDDDNRKSEKA